MEIDFDEIWEGLTTTSRRDETTLIIWFDNWSGSRRFVHITEDEAFTNGLVEECDKCGCIVGFIDSVQFHIAVPDDTDRCQQFPHAIRHTDGTGDTGPLTDILNTRQRQRDFDLPKDATGEEEAA